MDFKLIDVERKPGTQIEFKLVPEDKKPERSKNYIISEKQWTPYEKSEYERWSRRYDADHPWWVSEETRLRSILQSKREFGLEFLRYVIEWKFKELEGRKLLNLERCERNSEEDVRLASHDALRTSISDEESS